MNIYEMNDCNWYAAETVEQAIQCMSETMGESVESLYTDYELNPRIVTVSALKLLPFHDHENNEHRTFKKELELMIASGHKFPTSFATTEY